MHRLEDCKSESVCAVASVVAFRKLHLEADRSSLKFEDVGAKRFSCFQ
jgi:hypothetical protein